MNGKNILILQGGLNEEHKVSLTTAKEVNKALKTLGYNTDFLNVNPKNFKKTISLLNPDCCFNALHGSFGEDGQVQNILFNLNIPFTHSGTSSSIKAFNKNVTKTNLQNTKINCLESELISSPKLSIQILKEQLERFKLLVIKPLSSGSSYGVRILDSIKSIEKFINFELKQKMIYKNHQNLIIEPYIKGKELTVTVLERAESSEPIAVTEIISKNNFFDYTAKYTKGYSKHLLPANLSNSVYKQCLEHAKVAHDTLGCRGVSRSDFIYSKELNKLFFLEINTQPGLTPISLVPEQLKYKGITFIELIDLLIKLAKCQN